MGDVKPLFTLRFFKTNSNLYYKYFDGVTRNINPFAKRLGTYGFSHFQASKHLDIKQKQHNVFVFLNFYRSTMQVLCLDNQIGTYCCSLSLAIHLYSLMFKVCSHTTAAHLHYLMVILKIIIIGFQQINYYYHYYL